MSSTYNIVVKDGHIRVLYQGRQDFEVTNNSIAEAARLAKEMGIRFLMFDFTLADPRGYFAETIRHGEMAAELGITPELRIALYSPTHRDAIKFMETVAHNRGYNARAFTDEIEAVKWLTGA